MPFPVMSYTLPLLLAHPHYQAKCFPIKISLIGCTRNKGGETGHEKVDIARKVGILSFIL